MREKFTRIFYGATVLLMIALFVVAALGFFLGRTVMLRWLSPLGWLTLCATGATGIIRRRLTAQEWGLIIVLVLIIMISWWLG
ncbi:MULTISPECIES: hypothetical protein [unclassified Ligilactobacillus]|uniref:hypothetical protein n=1 Tax=unclassified Ligilactobacillus TaxID=2767920 RepID=UPI0038551304